jgi:uncharacterized protein with HEPN domain
MTPRDRETLVRIIDCLDAIDDYVDRAGERWHDDGMAMDAIAKRIEEIGEVAKRLSTQALSAMPGVDWRGVKGIREVIAHDYDDIEVDLVADVVSNDLPGLRRVVADALADRFP